MEFVYIIILSLVSAIVLFILAKLIGYRQISELSFFDYIVGITIGSVAAEMSTNIDLEWYKGIAAMVVYALIAIIFSRMSQKSTVARRMISGTPIILMENGTIKREGLKKARIEINDLLVSARTNGYFNLSDIDYAIMENTGKISFLPTPKKRQLNPEDFNFSPERDGLYINVIIDGKIMREDLKYAGISEDELKKQVASKGQKIENIMLATINLKKQLTIYSK
ncbi:MAG: DUF421 domain-containing protein [Acetobacter sp.]|nr:DUF421 domain-containing protein [Bacteroides sp.]MCM1340429.1 DUF421 domain-containing protein [Acetobacter sp.]MCM1432924.1 DUF421 domain-containing protein [Clostridiales bacterium]